MVKLNSKIDDNINGTSSGKNRGENISHSSKLLQNSTNHFMPIHENQFDPVSTVAPWPRLTCYITYPCETERLGDVLHAVTVSGDS